MRDTATVPTALDGRFLKLVQAIWIGLVILALVLWAIGSYESGALIPSDCGQGACDPFALSAGDLEIIADLTLPASLIIGFFALSNVTIALVFFATAGFVASRKHSDWMGLLVSFMFVFLGAVFFTDSDDALWRAHSTARWPLTLLGMVGYLAIMTFLFHSPDGRFFPERSIMRRLSWLAILATAPLAGTATRAGAIGAYPVVITVVAGLAAQVYRYRNKSDALARQQTKWMIVGLASSVLVMILWVLATILIPPESPSETRLIALLVIRSLVTILIPLLPLAIAFSIMRYRLWDVDVLIRRTLVYGILTIGVVALYAIVIGGLGIFVHDRWDSVLAILATAVAAVLFQPFRSRVQRAVNRLIYGERDNPMTALSKLGRRLESAIAPEHLISTRVETIGQTLKFD